MDFKQGKKRRKIDSSTSTGVGNAVESDAPMSLSQYVEQLRFDPQNTARVIARNEERHRKFIRVLQETRDRIMRSERRRAQQDSRENGDDTKMVKATVSSGKFTPLEQQVIEIKRRNPGVMLMVEVGYNMRFFGDDAHIASRILGVIAYKTHNLYNASIPTYRLNFHLRRLLAAGYKVGIVKQTETSAVKASGETDNKSGPFTRDIHSIYSRGTSILGDDVGDDGEVQHDCGYVVSIVEESMCSAAAIKDRRKQRTDSELHDDVELESTQQERIGIVCVNVSTGSIMYDCFNDTFMRRELSTRLTEIDPVEIILPSCGLSRNSELIISNVVATTPGDPIRVERIKDDVYDHEFANSNLKAFYMPPSTQAGDDDNDDNSRADSSAPEKAKDDGQSSNAGDDRSTYMHKLFESILELPVPVIVALNATLEYLRQYKLESMLKINSGVSLQSMDARNRVNLPGSTLQNLEILRNNTNYTTDGSLLALLDHTRTPFGHRLLKQWVCHPLVNADEIRLRLDAVEEISIGEAACLDEISESIKRMPDVEKTLMKASFKKCSPKEFLNVLRSLKVFYEKLPGRELWEEEIKSELLLSLMRGLPELSDVIDDFLSSFNHTAAEQSLRDHLFDNVDGIATKFPEINVHTKAVEALKEELDTHLVEIRKKVGKSNLELKDWKHLDNVIELTAAQAKRIENDPQFVNVHATKTIFRYQTRFIIEKNQRLQFHKEKLTAAAANAWLDLMNRFASHFNEFKRLVDTIATFDCLYSLAETARQGGDGYCKPQFSTDRHVMKLKNSRHPMIELALRDRPFVPNNVSMDRDGGTTAIILSGANMGGKSSLCRQVALIAVMAQIGSFVPCSSAILPVFDGIFIRAGAQDDVLSAKSTFFVELSETSEILARATPNSLVIMDELGRGTSTSDGKCIAYCTLEWLVKHVSCFCLFTTHYPLLFGLERQYPGKVRNYHMGHIAHEEDGDAVPQVTFLYKLRKGPADRSYGMNVARLAGLDMSILQEAERKAKEMEQRQMLENRLGAFFRLASIVLKREGDRVALLQNLSALQHEMMAHLPGWDK